MEKFIPYEKLSKKEQQRINKARRGTWGDLNPVTRKPANSNAYNRKRAQAWKNELPDLRSCIYLERLYSITSGSVILSPFCFKNHSFISSVS